MTPEEIDKKFHLARFFDDLALDAKLAKTPYIDAASVYVGHVADRSNPVSKRAREINEAPVPC
jgi:hypothetical protein